MKNMDPTEVLNDNMEFLVDSLKHKITMIGMDHGLSDSQISDMERDFIARLAFAAIIGDEKEPDKKPENSDDLPDDVINALLYAKRLCKAHECEDCPFSTGAGLCCRLCEVPSVWEV